LKHKLAIINRGISGSGKSTFITELKKQAQAQHLKIAVHSTDDLFMVNGVYCFEATKLGAKHFKNSLNFLHSLPKNDIVVCDNTNTSHEEYKEYVDVAHHAGFTVVAVVFTPDELEVHAARNTHNVPLEILKKQREKMLKNFETIYVNEEYVFEPISDVPFKKRIADLVEKVLANM
jgi:predicted kinase